MPKQFSLQKAFSCNNFGRASIAPGPPIALSPPNKRPYRWEPPGRAQRSPKPFGPGTPKESEKSPKGCPAPGSPRVPKECATESEKSPKRVRSCVFDSFSDSVADSLGTLGRPRAGHPFGLFSDSPLGVPNPIAPFFLVPRWVIASQAVLRKVSRYTPASQLLLTPIEIWLDTQFVACSLCLTASYAGSGSVCLRGTLAPPPPHPTAWDQVSAANSAFRFTPPAEMNT